MSSIALILHRARWQIAALRVRSALVRARLVLLRAYDPNQPRVPAGSQEGGRWTDGDSNFDPSFAPDGGRIVRVAEDGDRRYTVVLAEEEARGGHTLRKHVGRTDKQMLDRVRSSRQDVFFVVSYGLKRNGSFESIESANDFVNRTIELNKSIVDRVSSGDQRDAFLINRFGVKTGREAYTEGSLPPYMRTTYGVGVYILHDPSSPRGYRIRTAYPRNDGD